MPFQTVKSNWKVSELSSHSTASSPSFAVFSYEIWPILEMYLKNQNSEETHKMCFAMVKTEWATARKLLMVPLWCLQRKGSWKGIVSQRKLTLNLVKASRWLRFLLMLHLNAQILHLNTQILPAFQCGISALLTVRPAHHLSKSVRNVTQFSSP